MKKISYFGWVTVISVLIAAVSLGIDSCQQQGPNFYYDRDGKYVEITDPAGQCVLYRVLGPNTQAYKAGLFVVNYAAIKKGYYTGAEALAALDKLEKQVSLQSATVGSVINALMMVAAQAAKAGQPEVVLITQGLADYAGDPTPIDDCTRYKLIAYIGSQKNLAIAFGE